METIRSAAIRYRIWGDHELSVVEGMNHADCINWFAQHQLYRNLRDLDVEEQGFITSEGRFVDRREALEIARLAGQIPDGYNKDVLYSEFVTYKYEKNNS